MNEERRKQQILHILAAGIRKVMEEAHLDYGKLQEIRLRTDQPLLILYQGEELFLPAGRAKKHMVTKEEIKETLEYSSHYSLYAYENEIRQGFLTVEGGHRVGVAGKAILEQEKVKSLQHISSVNIRMSHEIPGCADRLLPMITKNREVVDERSEIGGCYLGVAQNHLGSRTDILDCCPKAEGMIMLIRSMSPRVLAVDEIGAQEEIRAVEYAMQCGCKLIASVHGNSMAEIASKPGLGELVRQRRFERYVVLENREHPGEIKEIFDERGSLLCRN